jgi:hypothetical protein
MLPLSAANVDLLALQLFVAIMLLFYLDAWLVKWPYL